MVRLNFRKSPPHARNTSKTHSEAVDFAGALGVTSNGGPTDRPRHSPYGRDAARVFLGSGSSLSAFCLYNWHRPHGSLKAQRPISRLGLSEDNVLRLHS